MRSIPGAPGAPPVGLSGLDDAQANVSYSDDEDMGGAPGSAAAATWACAGLGRIAGSHA